MSNEEFNPNSYDAVLGGIKSELHSISESLSNLEDNQGQIHKRISDLDLKVTKNVTDVNNKVVALEYFKNYLMGAVAVFSSIASYFFVKFFGEK